MSEKNMFAVKELIKYRYNKNNCLAIVVKLILRYQYLSVTVGGDMLFSYCLSVRHNVLFAQLRLHFKWEFIKLCMLTKYGCFSTLLPFVTVPKDERFLWARARGDI